MARVEVNGQGIFYREAGEGPPLLLIQGLEIDHRGWAMQVPVLREHFRCISFDNRDVGQSDLAKDSYTVREMATDALGLLDALGVQRAHIVGFSMGGAIAQEIAIEHPQCVDKVALLATYTSADARFRALNEGRKALRANLTLEEYCRATFPLVYTDRDYAVPDLVETTIQRVLANPNPQPPAAFARQVDAVNSHYSEDRLQRIAAPALVLCGEEDLLTPPRFSRLMAKRIPSAKLVLIPEAGHGVIWTRADEVNQHLLRFLLA